MSNNTGIDTLIIQPQIIDIDFINKIDQIIERTIHNGSLLVSGSGGSGKTFASMWIIRRVMQSANHQSGEYKITIVEPCLNYRYKFDSIPFIDYASTKLVPDKQDLIIDIYSLKPKAKRECLTSILSNDFVHKQELKIANNGVNTFKNFYMLDELHNVIGRYALVGNAGAELLDTVTECRNFGMYIIGVTRRLSDLSTSFVESCRTNLFGKTSGQNDLDKIEKMYGNKVSNAVANLKPRSFVYFDQENGEISEIGMPEFIAQGRPFEIKEDCSHGYVKYLQG